jgi:6-phosphogluconolactonase
LSTEQPPPGAPERLLVVGADRFAQAAAEAIAGVLAAALEGGAEASLALAGGSTPRPVYELLARRADLPWGRIRLYFGDERAVPPEDEESNYRMARESLVERLPEPPAGVHRMEAERDDPEAAAEDYAALLPRRLDLVLLGIGEDGHCASLFPGSPVLAERRRRVVPVVGPKPPPRRITVTPPVITGAGQTLVMAAGAAKAEAVARCLEGPYEPRSYPAQLARGGIWVVDRAAAAGLERGRI